MSRITKIKKGRLLQIGLKGKKYETKAGITFLYILYISLMLFTYSLAFEALRGRGNIAGSSLLGFLVMFSFGTGILLILLFMNGQEIDGVYQNGLTHRRVGWVKKWQGKHWIPWHEVERIEYGIYDKDPGCEYLRVYSGDKDSWYFHRRIYDKHNADFYLLLHKMLAERSPQARWVRKDLLED